MREVQYSWDDDDDKEDEDDKYFYFFFYLDADDRRHRNEDDDDDDDDEDDDDHSWQDHCRGLYRWQLQKDETATEEEAQDGLAQLELEFEFVIHRLWTEEGIPLEGY